MDPSTGSMAFRALFGSSGIPTTAFDDKTYASGRRTGRYRFSGAFPYFHFFPARLYDQWSAFCSIRSS